MRNRWTRETARLPRTNDIRAKNRTRFAFSSSLRIFADEFFVLIKVPDLLSRASPLYPYPTRLLQRAGRIGRRGSCFVRRWCSICKLADHCPLSPVAKFLET